MLSLPDSYREETADSPTLWFLFPQGTPSIGIPSFIWLQKKTALVGEGGFFEILSIRYLVSTTRSLRVKAGLLYCTIYTPAGKLAILMLRLLCCIVQC